MPEKKSDKNYKFSKKGHNGPACLRQVRCFYPQVLLLKCGLSYQQIPISKIENAQTEMVSSYQVFAKNSVQTKLSGKL